MARRIDPRRLQAAAIALSVLPAVLLALRFAGDDRPPDPIAALTHTSGEWALRLVLLPLALPPLRRFAGLAAIAPLRRTFGLAAFAYAVVHLLTWSVLDLGLDPAALAEDVLERPYVTVGAAAFAILAALAATSTRAAQKRLGRRWTTLHRAAYAAAGLAVLHHFWLVKADLRAPIVHASILALLLGARLVWRLRLPPAAVDRMLPPRPGPGPRSTHAER